MQVNNNTPSLRQDLTLSRVSYKNGKLEKNTLDLKNCMPAPVEKIDIPIGSETYNNLVGSMKLHNSFSNNKMFYETYDIMKDYYSGKLSKEEVTDIYRTYCTSSLGNPGESQAAGKVITSFLEDMYEYFSRANTRNAVNLNTEEANQMLSENDLSNRQFMYYNSDYYYKCEEMQSLFKEISNTLSKEYGVDDIDFKQVEKDTRFTLDGGITYNGVWNFTAGMYADSHSGTSVGIPIDSKPPQNFIYYFKSSFFGTEDSEKVAGLNSSIQKMLAKKGLQQDLFLFYSETGNLFKNGKSYLLNNKDNVFHSSAVEFLKGFQLYRSYGSAEGLFVLK